MGKMVRVSTGVVMALLSGVVSAAERLDVISLPTGWGPEGIAIGHPWEVYVGAIFGGFSRGHVAFGFYSWRNRSFLTYGSL